MPTLSTKSVISRFAKKLSTLGMHYKAVPDPEPTKPESLYLLYLPDPTGGIDTALFCHQYTNVFELSGWSCSICSPGDSILVRNKHLIFSSLIALVLYTWSYLFITVWSNILTGTPLQSRSELVFSFLLVFCLNQASSRYQWSYNHVVFGQQNNGIIMN